MHQHQTRRRANNRSRTALISPAVALLVAVALAPSHAEDSPRPRTFTIASQPLDAALDAFIRSSGTQVFYETALTEGMTGAQVQGEYTSDAALSQLLAGTGLTARRTDTDTFIIVPAASGRAVAFAPVRSNDSSFMAALQHGVVDALCRSEQTRPGAYRVAIELWIGTSGVAQKVALVGSSGDPRLDHAIQIALTGLAIGRMLPADLPQPVVLTIGARSPRQTGDCAV